MEWLRQWDYMHSGSENFKVPSLIFGEHRHFSGDFSGFVPLISALRDAMGGGKKRGEENLRKDTPPKNGFGPPFVWYVFRPPRVSVLVLPPVQKITTEQTRSSFGRVQKFSGGCVLRYVFLPPYVLHVFLPPYVLHPPHITAQLLSLVALEHCDLVAFASLGGNQLDGGKGTPKKMS